MHFAKEEVTNKKKIKKELLYNDIVNNQSDLSLKEKAYADDG